MKAAFRTKSNHHLDLQAERRRPRATGTGLLTGLLYDEAGNRFIPSQATKKGRRYRYYVSQALTEGTSKDRQAGSSSCRKVEELVLSQLTAHLQSAPRILDLLPLHSLGMTETQLVAKVTRKYLASQEKVRNDLRSIVMRIVVRQ